MLLRSFIFAGAINGLYSIFLLNNKAKNSGADRLLMIWMGIVSTQLLFYYDNLALKPLFPIYLQLICFSLPLISATVLYFYVDKLSFGTELRWKKIAIHLLPFLCFNVTTFFLYYFREGSFFLKDGLPHFNPTLELQFIYFLTSLLAIVPGYYAIMGLVVLLNYQKSLPNHYSYTERINLNWLKWIVTSLLILFICLFVLIKYGVGYKLVNYTNLFAVVGAVLSLYVFFIGYFGLKQHRLSTEITLKTIAEEKNDAKASYKNSGLTEQMIAELFKKLKDHMAKEQPFLQEDLNLTTLATQLAITSNQLSQVINQKNHTNFFNFINDYRVEAVKVKLKDPSFAHYSILGIAYDCGFSSKSSFNKIFKAATGRTPLQYQKENVV